MKVDPMNARAQIALGDELRGEEAAGVVGEEPDGALDEDAGQRDPRQEAAASLPPGADPGGDGHDHGHGDTEPEADGLVADVEGQRGAEAVAGDASRRRPS